MLGEKHCPFCKAPAANHCPHLALAVEGRDFVRRAVELSQARRQWDALCRSRQAALRAAGEWSPEREDFMWLETAFCGEFLKPLRWFAALDYEWRTDSKTGCAGFCALLWSKDPHRLWWELRDEIERQAQSDTLPPPPGMENGPWLFESRPKA